ncbi:MAG: hypothetical protein GWM90_08980 [Gemmatimonadetes bacterium]|nr:hypothetical protein [Gemmatimonadota bacterium]NIQ54028.1 hypothetical protein [Gemmatimonadota bacterium]NIU74212.1 hypothetical protein [Gammaproteobacteria bacterium]NIX44243.1 hypothetical protein [Gemmatimonadota bacterium]NIY08466.1 hypothetical protein [Gemmatimonadota bacterium]
MKRRWIFTLAAVFAFAACAGETEETEDAEPAASAAEETAPAMEADPDIAPEGEATALPAGYAVRLDQPSASTDDYRVTAEDGGLHVRTGPAGILYEEATAVESGDYSVSATFTEVGAPPNHREAFGLFIGGSDLEGEAQRYTYFLVRADGRYLIKKRDGGEMSDVSDGWVDSEAVNGAAEGGDVTNTLAIEVRGDQAHFSVNGTEVATHPVAELDAYGIAGVRINHNLDVRVEGFQLSN